MTEEEKTKKIEHLRALLKRVLERRKANGEGEPVRKIHAAGIYKGGAPYFSKCAAEAANILQSRGDVRRLWRYRKGWAAGPLVAGR